MFGLAEPLTSELKKALLGWFYPAKYNLERWAYALQRISGIAVTGYFLAHIVETGNVVGGLSVWSVPSFDVARDVWTATFHFLENPVFDIGLVVIGSMLAYHTINGIRLTLTEFGLLQGRPSQARLPVRSQVIHKIAESIVLVERTFRGRDSRVRPKCFLRGLRNERIHQDASSLHNRARHSCCRRATSLHSLLDRTVPSESCIQRRGIFSYRGLPEFDACRHLGAATNFRRLPCFERNPSDPHRIPPRPKVGTGRFMDSGGCWNPLARLRD